MKTEKSSFTTIQLRDYQELLIQQIYQAWADGDGKRKVLMQLPTGAGKTICFAQLAIDLAAKGEGVLALVHRKELLEQAASKISEATGQPVGIIGAGHIPNYERPIQIASVQSLKTRLKNLGPIGLVIVDECHHSPSRVWRYILSHFPTQYILGVTATPVRLDGTGFVDQYDVLIQGASVKGLIEKKALAPYRLFAAPEAMRTDLARSSGGDYNMGDVAILNHIIELSGHLIASYKRHANGAQAIVFAVNVAHSQAIADRYNAEGIPAAHLDGRSTQKYRSQVVEAFRLGKIKVLTNCNLFDEGFDVPGLECVQIARPTKSLSKYLQMLGRGSRIFKGKKEAIYIDHTTNYLVHGLPDADRHWTLDGVSSELVPIGVDENGEIIPIPSPEEKGGKDKRPAVVIELEYIRLQQVAGRIWPENTAERYLGGESIVDIAKDLRRNANTVREYIKSQGIKVRSRRRRIEWPSDTVKKYLAGASVADIAKDLECDTSSVFRYLKSLGVEMRGPKARIKWQDDAVKKYLAGASVADIVKDLECDTSSVFRYLKSLGVKRQNPKRRIKQPKNVVKRYLGGEDIRDIAKDLECSKSVVAACLKSLGVELRPWRLRWPDDIVERYLGGESAVVIAKDLGCHHSTVSRHLKSLGVKKRRRKSFKHGQ